MESSESQVHPAQFRERLDQYQRLGNAPLRLVYVPTHRDCPEVLQAVLDEMLAAGECSADEIRLLLIDD
ncbi:hypothetical protein [Actinomadura vinacea]|uniref:hypothetical protein n=1 Tax=Actinomadura vinacea TaxID=115336 RepID=UPI0031DA06A1